VPREVAPDAATAARFPLARAENVWYVSGMSKASLEKKTVRFDAANRMYILPGEASTVDEIVARVDRWRDRSKGAPISNYRIGKVTGRSRHTVSRFFDEAELTETEREVVLTPYATRMIERATRGNVNFETALQIIQAVGLDLELVVREDSIGRPGFPPQKRGRRRAT